MRGLLVALLALQAAACASMPAQEPDASPNIVRSTTLDACEGVDDEFLCLLRFGVDDWAGYTPMDDTALLEMSETGQVAALRAASLLGVDQGADAVQFSADGRQFVARERAFTEALRLDAAGASPEEALRGLDALPDASRGDDAPLSADHRKLRAYLELAQWNDAFIATRPSPTLVLAALERAEQLYREHDPMQPGPDITEDIAYAYGELGLLVEGRAYLARVGMDEAPAALIAIGDFAAAEHIVRRQAGESTCPSAHLAQGFGDISLRAFLLNDREADLRYLEAGLTQSLAALQLCGPRSVEPPSGVWRLADLTDRNRARAWAERLGAHAENDWSVLFAQRAIYQTLEDDAQICRVARLQEAADRSGAFMPEAYIAQGLNRCRTALEVWRDESVSDYDRFLRGAEAGVPIEELDAFLRASTDASLDDALILAARQAHARGNHDLETRLAIMAVAHNPRAMMRDLSDPTQPAAWRHLIYRIVNAEPVSYVRNRGARDAPEGQDPAQSQRAFARLIAPAAIAYELDTGRRARSH